MMPSLPQHDALYIHVKWQLFAVWFLEISISRYRQSLQRDRCVSSGFFWCEIQHRDHALCMKFESLSHLCSEILLFSFSLFTIREPHLAKNLLCLWWFNYSEYNGRITAGYSFLSHSYRVFLWVDTSKKLQIASFLLLLVFGQTERTRSGGMTAVESVLLTEMLLLSEV